jgi:hypothetical protein
MTGNSLKMDVKLKEIFFIYLVENPINMGFTFKDIRNNFKLRLSDLPDDYGW